MIELTGHTVIDGILIIANIGVMLVNLKIKSDISELKVYIHEHFATKADFVRLWKAYNER